MNGLGGSLGGVEYRASYSAKKKNKKRYFISKVKRQKIELNFIENANEGVGQSVAGGRTNKSFVLFPGGRFSPQIEFVEIFFLAWK